MQGIKPGTISFFVCLKIVIVEWINSKQERTRPGELTRFRSYSRNLVGNQSGIILCVAKSVYVYVSERHESHQTLVEGKMAPCEWWSSSQYLSYPYSLLVSSSLWDDNDEKVTLHRCFSLTWINSWTSFSPKPQSAKSSSCFREIYDSWLVRTETPSGVEKSSPERERGSDFHEYDART